MKLEQALCLLREGKKIWHPGMANDEYYMACKIFLHSDLLQDSIIFDELPLSIVWMKEGKEHPDMKFQWDMYDPKTDPCKHGMSPMINLYWIISDEWKMVT